VAPTEVNDLAHKEPSARGVGARNEVSSSPIAVGAPRRTRCCSSQSSGSSPRPADQTSDLGPDPLGQHGRQADVIGLLGLRACRTSGLGKPPELGAGQRK
jgi:hypothetical protein